MTVARQRPRRSLRHGHSATPLRRCRPPNRQRVTASTRLARSTRLGRGSEAPQPRSLHPHALLQRHRHGAPMQQRRPASAHLARRATAPQQQRSLTSLRRRSLLHPRLPHGANLVHVHLYEHTSLLKVHHLLFPSRGWMLHGRRAFGKERKEHGFKNWQQTSGFLPLSAFINSFPQVTKQATTKIQDHPFIYKLQRQGNVFNGPSDINYS
ncbi:uncharacterized protein [Miscanthus floridulus]|uniref:uncharacterized protein isoform X1 n=1 Tax=Miscanthus floridulus TaxID=154761 RepID=UPI00345887DA